MKRIVLLLMAAAGLVPALSCTGPDTVVRRTQARSEIAGLPITVEESRANGVRHGAVTARFENGQPYYVETYDHGQLHGEIRRYSVQGRLLLRQTYRHGELVASWERVDGEMKQTVKEGTGVYSYFDENGSRVGRAEYQDGKFVRAGR
jgi:antitoxin component YwqK of YwqJK toxin-antitoxin module